MAMSLTANALQFCAAIVVFNLAVLWPYAPGIVTLAFNAGLFILLILVWLVGEILTP